jgi:hypothetical protein
MSNVQLHILPAGYCYHIETRVPGKPSVTPIEVPDTVPAALSIVRNVEAKNKKAPAKQAATALKDDAAAKSTRKPAAKKPAAPKK